MGREIFLKEGKGQLRLGIEGIRVTELPTHLLLLRSLLAMHGGVGPSISGLFPKLAGFEPLPGGVGESEPPPAA